DQRDCPAGGRNRTRCRGTSLRTTVRHSRCAHTNQGKAVETRDARNQTHSAQLVRLYSRSLSVISIACRRAAEMETVPHSPFRALASLCSNGPDSILVHQLPFGSKFCVLCKEYLSAQIRAMV